MTKKIYTLAALVLISILLQAYLAHEFYEVQYGHSTGDSICNINEVFNCEAVAASSYSNLFGIPNAILGFVLNLVLLIALIGILISNDGNKGARPWAQFFTALSGLNFLMSIILAIISFAIIKKLCIFCLALYAIGALLFAIAYFGFKELGSQDWKAYAASLTQKSLIGLLISIPALGFVGHKIIKNEYSPKNMELEVQGAVSTWKTARSYDFNVKPLFTVNSGAPIKIVEFADFLCPHCSVASKTLKNFLKQNTDVELSFYAFPLDPFCNPVMNQKHKDQSPKFSCTLSQGVYCAEKQGKGAELHYQIFENQKAYRDTAIKSKNSGLIEKMSQSIKTLDINSWKKCLDSPEAAQAMADYSNLGKAAKVVGTPSLYMNGKKLPGGAHFMVLKEAKASLK